MKKQIEKLPPIEKESGLVHVIIETPKGSRIKYSYDTERGLMALSKALPEGMVFPFNFGFIPQTLGDDGDPLDMMVLNEEILLSGCLLKVHPIGVIKATQLNQGKKVRNDRIIGQAIPKETPTEFQAMKLHKEVVAQIGQFFINYNKPYKKDFRVLGIGGAAEAWEIIRRGIKLRRKQSKKAGKKK